MGARQSREGFENSILGVSLQLDDHQDLKKSVVVLPLFLVALSTASGRLKYRSQLRSLARLWLLS